jgi:hypothetical protein
VFEVVDGDAAIARMALVTYDGCDEPRTICCWLLEQGLAAVLAPS